MENFYFIIILLLLYYIIIIIIIIIIIDCKKSKCSKTVYDKKVLLRRCLTSFKYSTYQSCQQWQWYHKQMYSNHPHQPSAAISLIHLQPRYQYRGVQESNVL